MAPRMNLDWCKHTLGVSLIIDKAGYTEKGVSLYCRIADLEAIQIVLLERLAVRDEVLVGRDSEFFQSGTYDLEFNSPANPSTYISPVVAQRITHIDTNIQVVGLVVANPKQIAKAVDEE
ncbi:hypothetical protein HPG69_012275 [Diceros bicornis minor]|uniref:Uncharacterized protein n=1 Tax=Diceros bicornis minor TaxID=77932 RepID=A0A7J7F563_DICBM|nr:hypothetical protein HPG69_012275 [Diceros bicornis minor]